MGGFYNEKTECGLGWCRVHGKSALNRVFRHAQVFLAGPGRAGFKDNLRHRPGMNIGYGELKSIESYEFIKAVVEGRQPSTSFAEGYRVERVCDAVKRSAETGRWVTVND